MDDATEWIEWRTKKQMLVSHSAYFDRFMHLWNLLSRSNFYASCLLTIIEEKQRKRSKPSTKMLKKKKKKKKEDKIYTTVKSVVDELLSSVVELNSKEFEHIETNPFNSSDHEFVNDLLEPTFDMKVEHFTSESDSVCTVLTSEYANSEIGDYEEAKYVTEKLGLTEEDYKYNLSNRNKVMTSVDQPGMTQAEAAGIPVEDLDQEEDMPKNPPVSTEASADDTHSVSHSLSPKHHKSKHEDVETMQFDSQVSVKSEKLDCSKFPTTKDDRKTENLEPLKDQPVTESYRSNHENTMPDKVCCPICNRKYAIKSINKHLDMCTGRSEVKSSLRGASNSHATLSLGRKTRKRNSPPEETKTKTQLGTVASMSKVKAETTMETTFPICKQSSTSKKRRKGQIPNKKTGDTEEGEINLEDIQKSGRTRRVTKVAASLFGTRHMRTRKGSFSPSSASASTSSVKTPLQAISDSEKQEDKMEDIESQTGLQNIKSALEKTLMATQMVNEKLIAEAKKAVSKLEEEKKNQEFMKIAEQIKSPPRKSMKINKTKSPKVISNKNRKDTETEDAKKDKNDMKTQCEAPEKPKQQRKSPRNNTSILATADTCSMGSSSDSDEADIEIPSAPTRRSSRTTRSRISYQEVGSSGGDSDNEQNHADKKVKVSQKVKQKTKKRSDDEYELPEEKVSKVSENDFSAKAQNAEEPINEEEGELGANKVNVDELLEKRFYQPDVRSFNNLVTRVNGSRYVQGEMVDPSQPRLLIGGILREYQIAGYQWLKILYENGESGILADEMGLGKTIQCIAMICKLIQLKKTGPFLVCAPTTTINNWFSEFKRFAPQVSLLLYYGAALERVHLVDCLVDQTNRNTPLVVITSYEILMRDLTVFRTYNWSYLVLDEGHRVKNIHGKTLKDIKVLSTEGKVMLTGTPLQNNLTELWSLLNFLFPEVFDDVKSFQSWFDLDLLKKDDKILSMLHQVLTPFLLRRVKADVDIKIPPKREMLVLAPLAPLQDQYYRAVVDKSIIQLIKNQEYYDVTPGVADPDLIASNSQEEKKPHRPMRSCLKQKYGLNVDDFAVNVTLSNMMMLLRKCCNHPYLVHHPIDANTQELKIDENLVTSCGKMMLLDRMLPCLKEGRHKVLLFSQMTSMLDILEDFCKMRNYSYVRFDGKTRCEERVEYINQFNSDPSIFIFLLSTRAGGIGINLTGADTVIIYDSDWNPQNDIQAQDRCHRIGQEKPVVVYRLVTASTIDQQIMERAAKKRVLEKMIIHEGKFKGELDQELSNLQTITPSNLLNLLENTQQCNRSSNVDVMEDQDLRKLLDRSDMKWSALGNFPTPKLSAASPRSDERKANVGKLEAGSSGCTVSGPQLFRVIEETHRRVVF